MQRTFVVDAALERRKVKKNEEIPQEIVLPNRGDEPAPKTPPRTEFKVLSRDQVMDEETEEERKAREEKKKKEDEDGGTPLAYRIGAAIIGVCLVVSSIGYTPGLMGFDTKNKNDPEAFEKAEKTWSAIVEKDPKDGNALRYLVNAKVNLKKFDEAMPLLERLATIQPDDAEVAEFHAALLAGRGEDAAGLRRLEAYLRRNPFDTSMLQTVEAELQGTGRVEEAVALAERTAALAADPRDGGALSALRAFYADAGVGPAGEERAPKRPSKEELLAVRLVLGQVYTSAGDFDKAIGVFEACTKEYPKDYRAYIALGSTIELSRPGDAAARAEAQVLYQKAIEVNPKEAKQLFEAASKD